MTVQHAGQHNPLRRLARSAAYAVALGLAGCADPGANLQPLPDTAMPAYHLAPGDEVSVVTFAGRELSGRFILSETGSVAVPLLGEIHAAGMTATELQSAIAERLIRLRLFTHPSVAVEVIEYRPVFVLGDVVKPGRYRYTPGITVLGAVALAGGFTYSAVQNKFAVSRTAEGHKIEGLGDRQTVLRPGDVIEVFEKTI